MTGRGGENYSQLRQRMNPVAVFSTRSRFLLYAFVQFARTWTQFTGSKFTTFGSSMMIATNAMNFAPILSVLFTGARMRALQMDPVNGAPPEVGSELLLHVHIGNGCSGHYLYRCDSCVIWHFGAKPESRGRHDFQGGEQSPGRDLLCWPLYHHVLHLRWLLMCHLLGFHHPASYGSSVHAQPLGNHALCHQHYLPVLFYLHDDLGVGVTIKEFTGYEWQLLVNPWRI